MKKTMKTYTVICRSKFPAFGESPSQYEVTAKNKSEAIKIAKRDAERAGAYFGRGEGARIWTAEEDR